MSFFWNVLRKTRARPLCFGLDGFADRSSPFGPLNGVTWGQSSWDGVPGSSVHGEHLSVTCEQRFPPIPGASPRDRMSSMKKEVRGLTVSDISIGVIHGRDASRWQTASVGDAAEATCPLTNSCGVNLYGSRGGICLAPLMSDGGGPDRLKHMLQLQRLFSQAYVAQ